MITRIQIKILIFFKKKIQRPSILVNIQTIFFIFLELALRTSAAKEDPYHDNVRVELLPYDLIFQMCKILSIDTESEMDFKRPVNQSELTGLEAFAFGYDVQWPISLILNRKSLACYQMLLRHLLYCKHVEKLLTRYDFT